MMYLVKILGFALLFTTTAQAQTLTNAPSGAHFARGSGPPVCSINADGDTVSCTGTIIQGVGNTGATVELEVDFTATGTCTNRGGNLVEQFTEQGTTEATAEAFPTRNGELRVSALTKTATEADFLETFECPNPNWTADVTDITVTGFLYTLTFDGFDAPAIMISGP